MWKNIHIKELVSGVEFRFGDSPDNYFLKCEVSNISENKINFGVINGAWEGTITNLETGEGVCWVPTYMCRRFTTYAGDGAPLYRPATDEELIEDRKRVYPTTCWVKEKQNAN